MKTMVAGQALAEPEFLLAVQRAVRAPHDRVAILVHLSRLREARAPLPPPHQLHLARSILQDAAQRFEGQVFNLRNGDLALLCRGAGRPAEAPGTLAVDPSALPGILARLFHADMAKLVSVWPLTTQGTALLGYAADRLAETPAAAVNPSPPVPPVPSATKVKSTRAVRFPPARPAPVETAVPSAAATAGSSAPDTGSVELIEGIVALLAGTRVAELMRCQTAIRLRPGDLVMQAGGEPGATAAMSDSGFQPAFRELAFSIAALEARVASPRLRGQARTDPFLFHHLAARLDRRMLTALLADTGSRGPLDLAGAGGDQPPLHLNLTLPAILSDGFTRLADNCRGRVALGIEIDYVEACTDPVGFGRVRQILDDAGATLVLDGIDAAALRLTRPWRLMPDILKLAWSSELATEDADAAADIVGTLDRIGPESVVLTGAETAGALAWGMARGIELFQGGQVEAMLGARRIGICALAPGCTTRQCIDRAAAVSAAGRSGCGNTRLLDTGRSAPPGPLAPFSPRGRAPHARDLSTVKFS